jgi:hypothetical protein
LLAADEAGELDGQVMAPRSQRGERGEVSRQLRVGELPDTLGPLHVFQPVLAEVAQAHVCR